MSGGESPSMLVAIRDCVKASNVISFDKSTGFKPLNFQEAFFLATLGGSQGKLSTKLLNYFAQPIAKALISPGETPSHLSCLKNLVKFSTIYVGR